MSAKPTIFVLDPYHEKATATLREESRNLGLFQPTEGDSRKEAPGNFDVVFHDDPAKSDFLTKATLLLVRSESGLSADVLSKAGPQLKYIVKQGTGVDNIDLDAASKKGIQVYNTPGINSESVAELTIGLALSVARRITETDRLIRDGEKVVRSQLLGKSLHSKTLGIIGMGAIGIEVARKWRGLTSGVVLGYDTDAPEVAWTKEFPEGQFERVADLDDLLERSDVVTVHVPLVESTKNLLSEERIAKMKQDAILLNCARGGIVDEAALLEALNAGKLFGAGLDAVEKEPPSKDNYGQTLLSHPRVIITPHIGAGTEENQAQSGVVAVDIAVSLIEGRKEQIPKALNVAS